MIDTNPSFFSQITVDIGTQVCVSMYSTKFKLLQLPESSLLKLHGICRSTNIVLVVARSYGLTGLVRASIMVLHISSPNNYDKFLHILNYHDDILSQLSRTGRCTFLLI